MKADARVTARNDLALFVYLQDMAHFGWYRVSGAGVIVSECV